MSSEPSSSNDRRPAGPEDRAGWSSRAAVLLHALVDRLSVGDGTMDRPPLGDVLLAGVLAVLALGAYLFDPGEGVELGSVQGVAGGLLIAVSFGSLAWRRVVPTTTMVVAGLGTGTWFIIGLSDGAIPLAVMVALYSVAAYGSRSDGVVSVVITEFFVVVSFLSIMARGVTISYVQLAVNLLLFLGLWVLGDRTRVRRELVGQLRARAEQAERSREMSTELAVAEERTRIARELHDVAAHSVSVMVVQAGAGRRVAEHDPVRAAETLGAIEDVGRDALADLRRMVGILRDGTAAEELAPQPTLADVGELTQRLAKAGLPVRLEYDGEVRRLSSGVELSGYRIVQEALTNVLKHAGTVRRVVVTLRYGAGALAIEVIDDGRGAAAGSAEGLATGSGLLGMRERVAMFDGRLNAEPRPDGGFGVRAVLPLPLGDGTADADRSDDPTHTALGTGSDGMAAIDDGEEASA